MYTRFEAKSCQLQAGGKIHHGLLSSSQQPPPAALQPDGEPMGLELEALVSAESASFLGMVDSVPGPDWYGEGSTFEDLGSV